MFFNKNVILTSYFQKFQIILHFKFVSLVRDPKIKIVSSFTQPFVIPNCIRFFLILNRKYDILKNQTVVGLLTFIAGK